MKSSSSSRSSTALLFVVPVLAATAVVIASASSSSSWIRPTSSNKKKNEEEKKSNHSDHGMEDTILVPAVATTTPGHDSSSDENNEEEQEEEEDMNRPMREISTDPNTTHNQDDKSPRGRILSPGTITIVHGSVTGTCAKLAEELYRTLQGEKDEEDTSSNNHASHDNNNRGLSGVTHRYSNIQMGKLEEWDWWDELLNNEEEQEEEDAGRTLRNKNVAMIPEEIAAPPVLLVLLPTHHGGSWPPTAMCLETVLQDLSNDWRIAKHPLDHKTNHRRLHVGIMGMGCSDYGDDSVGKPARDAFQTFRQLGAAMMGRQVRIGDDATGNQDRVLQSWIHHDLLPRLIVDDDDDDNEHDHDNDNDDNGGKEPDVTDMEDLGHSMERAQRDNAEDSSSNPLIKTTEPREMVTASQAVALKKEGYKLIGTHSAVKLCRWTKHQLRGRGGCYKHTFYGITSYQCMEATPSLACANKCVFCWRHHKNPVGKEWKWKTDDPHYIVEEAVKTHVQMIKETKGIPGVNTERWKEAHTVRHCALSLVGEPIMYPRINELLSDLHERNISTFLVTNGQHPKAIDSLIPVTQLYVSVDAPNPESLIAIDRPLFSDAWDRLKQSLELLKDKGQRTVARLTVVKGWNSDDVEGYAKLIALGKVSLIEVKGVTFCGKSDASNLNMSNTPWHHEVVDLVRTLKVELDRMRLEGGPDAPPEYDLACEHKHSVSVLLARVDQFAYEAADGSRLWKTWIDYPKFQALAAEHEADPTFTFGVEDYVAETPAWALFGSEEEGFDPTDTRHRKKQKYPKYTMFDEKGVPTHDHDNQELSQGERAHLLGLMMQKLKEVGSGTTVTEMKSGEKIVQDASLMFRGQVIVK